MRARERLFAAAAPTGELRPNAWDPPAAGGTAPVGSDALLFDDVPVAFDHQVTAIGAVRVLPVAYATGQIPRVHEPQARPRADLTRTQQRRRGGIVGVGRSEEHTSELQSRPHLVCRLLL